eukprot:m.158362 g.158362  ORF g.158362 m.158362 type:complete len:685 (+) comp23694_c1_seq5:94-2148(+)
MTLTPKLSMATEMGGVSLSSRGAVSVAGNTYRTCGTAASVRCTLFRRGSSSSCSHYPLLAHTAVGARSVEYGWRGPATLRDFVKPPGSPLDVGMSEIADARTATACFVCHKPRVNTLICGSCKTVAYCSNGCQKTHWRRGHRMACVPAKTERKELKAFAKTMLSLGGVGCDPINPCAYCHRNEGHGYFVEPPAVCTACGIMMCGLCLVRLQAGKIDLSGGCPVCGVTMQVSDEEDIVRLKKVVATREAKIRGQGPDQLLGTAAFELSSRYRRGMGVSVDMRASVRWLKVAVEHEQVQAYSSLGLRTGFGEGGLLQDSKEAARLHRVGADRGDIIACANLAAALFRGNGVVGDVDAAQRWWRAAAWNLLPAACFELACALYRGCVITSVAVGAPPDSVTPGIIRNWDEACRLLWVVLDHLDANVSPTFEVNKSPVELLNDMLTTRDAIVEISNLTGAPEHNGRIGTVQSHTGRDERHPRLPERVQVLLDGTAKMLSIRPRNIRILAPARAWADRFTEVDDRIDPKFHASAVSFRWEYACDDADEISWRRYPPRIEVGIESMFNVGVPGQTQAEYDNLKATMRAAGPASAKIVDQMEAEGDGPDGDKYAPHFLYQPGVPGIEGAFEQPLLSTRAPTRYMCTRQVWFNRRDLVGAFEVDLYTGARRAVRRVPNGGKDGATPWLPPLF